MKPKTKINLGFLFIAAVILSFSFSFLIEPLFQRANANVNVYIMPKATELSKQDTRFIAQQIAEYCQSGIVVPEVPTIPAVKGRAIPVFIYHRVTDESAPSREVISPTLFKEHLKLLKELQYTTITISQLSEYMKGKIELPEKTVALTFDDGWKDNVAASNMLSDFNMAGTFYIISGFFNNVAYVNKEDVLAMSRNKNFEIGSHTHSHFLQWETKLNTLDLCTMAGEMASSKLILERLIRKPVRSIAWPYGYNTREAVHVALKLGYTSTVMVNKDSDNEPGMSSLFIRRMNIDGNCGIEEFKQMLETKILKECS